MKTHITPKQAAVLFIPFMILILLASCNRTPVAAEEAATENAHGPEVELTPEQAKAAEVQLWLLLQQLAAPR